MYSSLAKAALFQFTSKVSHVEPPLPKTSTRGSLRAPHQLHVIHPCNPRTTPASCNQTSFKPAPPHQLHVIHANQLQTSSTTPASCNPRKRRGDGDAIASPKAENLAMLGKNFQNLGKVYSYIHM